MPDNAYADSPAVGGEQIRAGAQAWGDEAIVHNSRRLAVRRVPFYIACLRALQVPTTTALLGITLLLPVLLVAHDGVSLTGFQEESVGYRYFYSLRLLYGDAERPWLPQGQAVGLAHMAVQLALTALGYPPTQLFPRIDLFAYAASALPLLGVCAAYLWAQQSLSSLLTKLILGATVVAIYFDRRSWNFDVLTKPDYQAWVGVVGLITLGWILRLEQVRFRDAGLRQALWLGVFGGVCLAIKPTYVIFPATITLVVAGHQGLIPGRWRRVFQTVRLIGAGIATALATFLAIVLAYYTGSVEAVVGHLRTTATFINSVGSTEPFWHWLEGAVLEFPPDFIVVSSLLPLFVAGTALLSRNHFVLAYLPGALIATWFIYQRFTTATLLEANFFSLVVVGAWLSSVKLRWLVKAGVLCMLVLLAGTSVARFVTDIYPSYRAADAQAGRWAELVASVAGPTLFLVPDNEWRFQTVDTAILKGGTGVNYSEGWGSSPLVTRMFPERWYFRPDATLPTQKRLAPNYTKVAFVRALSADGASAAVRRLDDAFGMSVAGLECLPAVRMSSTDEMVLCLRPTGPAESGDKASSPGSASGASQQRSMRPEDLLAAELSALLGATVEPIAGEANQFLARAQRASLALNRLGAIDNDVGYAVALTLRTGERIGLRFEPTPPASAPPDGHLATLSAQLGVPVDPAPGEPGQYLVRADRGSVHVETIGRIYNDVGYAVGLALPNGDQIGLRFEPRVTSGPVTDGTRARALSALLGVQVDAAPQETSQFLVRAERASVNLNLVGAIHNDTGYAVGLTLPSGERIGLRFEPFPTASSP